MTHIQAIQASAASLYASLPSMAKAGVTLKGFAASVYAALPSMAQVQALPGMAYGALPSMAQISAKAGAFKAAALTPQGAMITVAVVVTAVAGYMLYSYMTKETPKTKETPQADGPSLSQFFSQIDARKRHRESRNARTSTPLSPSQPPTQKREIQRSFVRQDGTKITLTLIDKILAKIKNPGNIN